MIPLYNNIGVGALAIIFVLQKAPEKSLPLEKVFLIMPLASHSETIRYLSRKNVSFRCSEELIVKNIDLFINFNARYYDNIVLTTNTIQLLITLEFIKFGEHGIMVKKFLEYNNGMGNRVGQISKASGKIARLLEESSEKLYLNLRVRL